MVVNNEVDNVIFRLLDYNYHLNFFFYINRYVQSILGIHLGLLNHRTKLHMSTGPVNEQATVRYAL